MSDRILTPPTRTPWFPKLALTLFAGVGFFDILFMASGLLQRILPIVWVSIARTFVLQLLFAIFLSLWMTSVWQKAERKGSIDSPKWYARSQGILRYWLAFVISLYGFAKILRLQFAHVLTWNDLPAGKFTGLELTWYYFGYSYVFAVIIAIFQIGGCILLLFRRTTLLGSIILLPVMINIFLIDLFYHIPFGALLNCILYTLGLIFLLYLRRKELIDLFLRSVSQLPRVGQGWMRWGLRIMVIGGAFGIECLIGNSTHSFLEGKWNVDRLQRRGHTFKEDEWLTNSGSWTTVYLEKGGKIVFCPNPYIYEIERSYEGSYKYDAPGRRLQAVFDNGTAKDTLVATVDHYDGSHMEWRGLLGPDTLSLQLSRARR